MSINENINQYKIDRVIQDAMNTKGKIERYCLKELFIYLNATQDKYTYEFLPTETGESICYDGCIYIRYRMTGTIVAYYILEAKVRDKDFDELLLEKKKLNNLKKEKKKKEDYFLKQYCPKVINLMYINFCPNGTYLYDLTYLMENNLLPKETSIYANKVTVDKSQGKIDKKVYLLPTDIAVKKNFVFDEKEYALELLNEAQKNVSNAISTVKKVFSLF